jgi:hypothetical protein
MGTHGAMQLALTNQEAPDGVNVTNNVDHALHVDEQPLDETNELESMFTNDAIQVSTNMEQQPQRDGAIGRVNPSDPMEVGVIYMRMNDVENMEGKDT